MAHYEVGRYRCLVLDQAWDEENANKTPCLIFKVRVEHGLHEYIDDGGEVAQDDVPLTQNYERNIKIHITEKSAQYAAEKLRFAGFSGDAFSKVNLLGATVIGDCKHETRDGKTYEKWDLALPPRSGGGAPLKTDAAVARKVDALFGKVLKAPPGAIKTAPALASVGAGGLDDIF